MKFYAISLISLCFAACQADRASDVAPKLDELDVVTEVPNPPSIATTHQGDWSLIDGENPRTVWMDGVWGMKTPNCHGETKPISTLIMNYSDFIVQFSDDKLTELIGPYYWSWSGEPDSKNEPDSSNGDNDIKVIVYRNKLATEELTEEYWRNAFLYSLSLEDVKSLYPTDQSEQHDYRYLAYTDALEYLDEATITMPFEDLAKIMIGRKFEIKGMFCKIPH